MILSLERRFLFIKTTKTAGTSVELALSQVCGSRDVITPLMAEDEAIRKANPGPNQQNFLMNKAIEGPGRIVDVPGHGPARMRFYNHMPAAEIRSQLAEGAWDGLFKFCVARNPWDRVVSAYFYTWGTESEVSFSRFVRSGKIAELQRKGRELYTIDGSMAVDRICRYETLADDLARVFEELKLGPVPPLPRAKSGIRPKGMHYRDLYSPADRDRIGTIFKDEIESLGYMF